MKKMKFIYLIIAIVVLSSKLSYGQTTCDYTIPLTGVGLDLTGIQLNGQTICLVPGVRNELTFVGIAGSLGNEIIIKPANGLVTISPSAANPGFCIKFVNCQHFILSGSYANGPEHGIKLELAGGDDDIKGIKTIDESCSDFTIKNIEISHGDYCNNTAIGIYSNPQIKDTGEPNDTWGAYEIGGVDMVGFIQKN